MATPDSQVELLVNGQPISTDNPLPTSTGEEEAGGAVDQGAAGAEAWLVNTELAAALAAGDTMANPTTAPTISHVAQYDPVAATWLRRPANVVQSATINANGNYFNAFDALHYNWVAITFSAANNVTLHVEVSNDGTTWIYPANFFGYNSSTFNIQLVSTSANPLSIAGIQGPLPYRYFRLRAASYGGTAVTAVATFSMEAAGQQKLIQTTPLDGSGTSMIGANSADGLGASLVGQDVRGMSYAFNEGTWDRYRNNIERLTGLNSAARTVTTNGTDQVNYNHRGASFIINVSAGAGAGSITPTIQGKDSVLSSAYYDIVTGSAISATGTYAVRVYPGLTAGANMGNDILPRVWRVRMVHADATSYTYSVVASMVL